MTREDALIKIKELEKFIKDQDSISKAQILINRYGNNLINDNAEVKSYKKYIKVPLPGANTEWTLEAFDYVKRVCNGESEDSSVYPVHEVSQDNSNWLWIRVE